MKWLVLAVIILAQQPAKAPEGKGTAKSNNADSTRSAKPAKADNGASTQSTPISSQPTVGTESKGGSAEHVNTAPTNNQQADEEDRAIQRKLVWFTGALGVVGVLQVGIMFLQLLVYRRQAHEMTRSRHEIRRQRYAMEEQGQVIYWQLRAMHEQITEMSIQSGILQDSVAVARDAATAAKKSVDIVISKERAWILVEKPIADLSEVLVEYETFFPYRNLSLVISHYGPTEAFDVRAEGDLLIGPANAIPIISSQLAASSIIRPGTPPLSITMFLVVGEDDEKLVQRGEAVLHVRGRITYRDRFDETRTTTFWYIYEVERFRPDESSDHYEEIWEWRLGGEPADNQAT
jgi:hypothetical protein